MSATGRLAEHEQAHRTPPLCQALLRGSEPTLGGLSSTDGIKLQARVVPTGRLPSLPSASHARCSTGVPGGRAKHVKTKFEYSTRPPSRQETDPALAMWPPLRRNNTLATCTGAPSFLPPGVLHRTPSRYPGLSHLGRETRQAAEHVGVRADRLHPSSQALPVRWYGQRMGGALVDERRRGESSQVRQQRAEVVLVCVQPGGLPCSGREGEKAERKVGCGRVRE